MKAPGRGGVSCLEYRDELKYGVWSGQVYSLAEHATTSISLEAPPLAIATAADGTYLGTAEGEVWKVTGGERTLVLKEKDSLVGGVYPASAVVGVHRYRRLLVVVFMHGEILLRDLDEPATVETLRADGVISFSTMKNDQLLWVVDNIRVKAYAIDSRRLIEKRSLVEDARITQAAFVNDRTGNTIVYGTDVGKVCVDYLVEHVGQAGYVFKAHKQEVANRETFFPVTVVCSGNNHEVVTGGAEGKAYLWDIKIRKRIKTLYSTGKAIVGGCLQTGHCSSMKLALVLGPTVESLYSPAEEAAVDLAFVQLKGTEPPQEEAAAQTS